MDFLSLATSLPKDWIMRWADECTYRVFSLLVVCSSGISGVIMELKCTYFCSRRKLIDTLTGLVLSHPKATTKSSHSIYPAVNWNQRRKRSRVVARNLLSASIPSLVGKMSGSASWFGSRSGQVARPSNESHSYLEFQKPNIRMVESFSKGRVFLAGE